MVAVVNIKNVVRCTIVDALVNTEAGGTYGTEANEKGDELEHVHDGERTEVVVNDVPESLFEIPFSSFRTGFFFPLGTPFLRLVDHF